MALLHAFDATRRSDLSAVATFDHGSGAAAAEAVELVVRECLGRSISVVAGRAPGPAASRRTESAWRSARWTFLRAVAEERRATIVTAHTLDDQAETVAIRILRGSSARGLAAMEAPSVGVVRPFLAVSRAQLAAYADREGVRWFEDPSNSDAGFLRNRLRADLMRTLRELHPGFDAQLIGIGRRAAAWRAELAKVVDGMQPCRVGAAVVIEAGALEAFAPDSLRIVWPEIASRAGVVMDRRGIERLVEWTSRATAGQRMPLSGGALVERTARTFVIAQRTRTHLK